MLSDSTIVPSGVVQLMEKQEKGWSYVLAVSGIFRSHINLG